MAYTSSRSSSNSDNEIVEFKNNEIKFYERIRFLERDLELRDNKIENLKNELEEVKKEKDSIDVKIKKIENSTKDLDCLLRTQRSVKDKTGLGLNEYTAVPPPPAQVYSPPKNDLSWTGLREFVDDTVTDYSRPTPSIDMPRDQRLLVHKGNLVGKKETPKQNHPKRNQRNWNNQKSQQLGSDFVMIKKACYVCGSFEHLQKIKVVMALHSHKKMIWRILLKGEENAQIDDHSWFRWMPDSGEACADQEF
ncbi:hypothetical protein Tco_1018219 [Tanacetum coccineum]|uniref:Uncharacterized protein n=1 Tax=Tanacetum coccineum TaxID=301880 RepID=A0ABQ5FUS3_9ASTR